MSLHYLVIILMPIKSSAVAEIGDRATIDTDRKLERGLCPF